MNLQNKSVLVLGMGETGLSMTKWLLRLGADVRVADSRELPPYLDEIAQVLPSTQLHTGKFNARLFEDITLIAISPGISLMDPFLQIAKQRGVAIVGDITLLSWALKKTPEISSKVLAITGSNGKTTVTTLVGNMLQRSGWDVEVAGNIGPAVLDVLMRRIDSGKLPQIWVLEISSFQLEATHNLEADIAAVLNLSEDHLDRYTDLLAYAAAKASIFKKGINAQGIQIINRDDPDVCVMAQADKKQITFGLDAPLNKIDFGLLHDGNDVWLAQGETCLIRTSELLIAGLHNTLNALAALAICRAMNLPFESLLQALREFRGLPHRMEKVAAFNGVTIYDDSKSTNVGATVAALTGMEQKIVLIAGGDGKSQDFSPLQQPIADYARAVVLIGCDAKIIAAAIKDCRVPLHFAETMQAALQISFLLAHIGDVILLSPACASFDMFKNYVHRAEVFVAAVRDIEVKERA